ncbi:hypothetical protein X975_01476, partial [Stegodyphus mimosarum]
MSRVRGETGAKAASVREHAVEAWHFRQEHAMTRGKMDRNVLDLVKDTYHATFRPVQKALKISVKFSVPNLILF